jgi:hypothetical protein
MTDKALQRLPRHERPHKLDVLGALLMTSATMTLLLALSWGGVRIIPGARRRSSGLVARLAPALDLLRLAAAHRCRAADPADASWPIRSSATPPSPPASAWAPSLA